MKRPVLIIASLLLLLPVLSAQTSAVPYAELTSLEGKRMVSHDILDKDAVNIIVFWRSCDQKCCRKLDAMHEIWLDSLKDRGVQMVCICVDGLGDWTQVKPVVDGNCWEFDTYIDVNCDLKRAMNITSIPCTILLDETNKLICRYNGFCTGGEKMLYDKLRHHRMTALK